MATAESTAPQGVPRPPLCSPLLSGKEGRGRSHGLQHLPPAETSTGSLLCAVDHQLTGPRARVQMSKGPSSEEVAVVKAGSWELSSTLRRRRARGRGRVHDSRAPALAARSRQAEDRRLRCVPGTPPSDGSAHQAKNCPPGWRVVSCMAHLLARLRGRTRDVWSWGHNLRKQELPVKAEFQIPTSS